MKKAILIAITLLFITACAPKYGVGVSSESFSKAKQLCKGKGGVSFVNTHAHCGNGDIKPLYAI